MNRLREMRTTSREMLTIAALLAALALAGFAAYRLAWPHYLGWRGDRAVAEARAFLGKGDLENAGLALQVAMRSAPKLEAFTVLADVDEAANSQEAVTIRRLAAQIDPGNLPLRLALVSTALKFNDFVTARLTLGACSAAEKQSPAYLRAMAACALLSGDLAAADTLMTRLGDAVRADPGLRLIRDSIWLRGAAPARRAAAHEDLGQLAADPAQRLAASRVLLADAFARRQPMAALEAANTLAAEKDASLSDLLDAAAAESFVRGAAGRDPDLIRRIEARAGQSPAAAAHYVRWLLGQGGPAAASSWIEQLPARLRDDPLLLRERANLAALAGNETELRRLLAAGAWGPLSGPAVDFAYGARPAARYGSPDLGQRTWGEALAAAGDSPVGLDGLAHLASAWHWTEAADAAMVFAIRRFPGNRALFQRFAEYLHSRGESRALLQAVRAWREGDAADASRGQDWALLSLLVEPTAAPNEATRLFEGLHRHDPDNPYYTTNYAFALWQLRRFREASALLDTLPPAEKSIPVRAPYLAIVYASAGRRDDARAALTRMPSAPALLPEEAALATEAYAKTAQ